MYILGTVERQANEEVIILEEAAPVIVEQDAVRLQGVLYLLATGIFLLQFHRLAEERKPCHQWLAAMPAETDGLLRCALDVLPDVCLKQFVAHARHCSAVNFALVAVVAIVAVEVARRAYGLHHCPECRCTPHLGNIGKVQIVLLVTFHLL